MNRSILIILCDFLLVTLVAFSNFDAEKAPPAEAPATVQPQATAGQEDLVGTLRRVLEQEQQSREQIVSNLQTTAQVLAEREKKVQQLQEDLRRTESQASQVAQERAALAEQAASAQARLTAAQSNLVSASTEKLLSQEMVLALEADLKRREEEARALQQRLAATEQSVQAALTEKQQLHAQLQVSEAEKRITYGQVEELKGAVLAEREEKAKLQQITTVLATNYAALAQTSGALVQEIRDQRPLTANAIYSQFLTNRVTAQFAASRSGLLGREVVRDAATQGLIFSKGKQSYLLLHVEDTPLTLWNPGTDWNRLMLVLAHSSVTLHAARLSFLAEDPRIIVIPVEPTQATQLGVQAYPAAPDPAKYQEAVIVGANEDYYGECKFQLEASAPQYLKLDRSFIRGLFGKFNPSRGDLVLSKTGELLGIMANREYCVVLTRVTPSRTIQLGNDIRDQHTGQILSQLFDRLDAMPPSLR